MDSPSIRLIYLVGLCSTLLLTERGAAQTIFTNVTDEAVLRPPKFGSRSTSFADYDNDGRPDMFLGGFSWALGAYHPVSLLHNEGNGTYANQNRMIATQLAGVVKGGGAVFGDYDNDGDLDLFVPMGAIFGNAPAMNVLLRNDQGVFTDVALAAGLTAIQPTSNAIWFDYDRDGFIDLYTGNVGAGGFTDSSVRNKLYRNNGNGTFADMTETLGLDVQLHPTAGGSNGGLLGSDLSGDGWPDLYIGVFNSSNRIFLGSETGGFDELVDREIADVGEAFGIAVGDIDLDGRLDLFQASGVNDKNRSSLFLNRGNGRLLDITGSAGLGALATVGLQGAGLADVDNDGDLDAWFGTTSFSEIVDYFPGSLYHNNGNANHWLRVELVGVASNRSAIGAQVFATTGDRRQMHEILGGNGRDQNELVAHFGLGQHTQVDRLEVR